MRHFYVWAAFFVVFSGEIYGDNGTLYYDAATGDVFFDVNKDNGLFEGIEFRSRAGRIQTDNYRRLGEPTVLFSANETYIVDSAGIGTFRPDGFYGLGAIYPTNVSEEDFVSDVSSRWGGAGSLATPFDIEFARPQGIPRNDPNLPQLQDAWAEAATLTYFAPTGELTMDTAGDRGGFITSYGIKADLAKLDPAQAMSPGSAVFYADANELHGVGILGGGVYSFGNVMQPNLTPIEFTNAILSAQFRGSAGVGSTDFELQSAEGTVAFALVHIPEPATGLLLLLGFGIAALRQRSRRS